MIFLGGLEWRNNFEFDVFGVSNTWCSNDPDIISVLVRSNGKRESSMMILRDAVSLLWGDDVSMMCGSGMLRHGYVVLLFPLVP